MHSTTSISKTFLALLGATSVAHAHSWIEQLTVIAPNGTFVGEPGFPRGNVKRSDPGFGDPAMVHLITEGPNDPMCKDSQKSPSSQSASSPRLKAAPGASIALRYQENGHVTLPETQPGKAENRGDVFVYGTTKPKDDELFADVHNVWTADGNGGDGRGVLLVKASYDDGQCYQVNGGAISTDRQKQFAHPASQLMGADLWCQTDVKLPADAPTDQPYTLYWVWNWETAPGIDPGLPQGKKETYTTCMDIDGNPAVADSSQKVASGGFIQGQPVENAAVPAQFAELSQQSPAAASNSSAPAAPAPSAPAQSAPASSAPAPAPQAPAAAASDSSAPVSSPAAPAAPAPAPSAPAQSAPAASVPAPVAPAAQDPAASDARAPPLAPPFPAPTASTGAILTTISPIPGPEASSAPASSAPGPNPAATAEDSIATFVTSSRKPVPSGPEAVAATTMTVTVTSPTPVTMASAAPKIRGRNRKFRLGV